MQAVAGQRCNVLHVHDNDTTVKATSSCTFCSSCSCSCSTPASTTTTSSSDTTSATGTTAAATSPPHVDANAVQEPVPRAVDEGALEGSKHSLDVALTRVATRHRPDDTHGHHRPAHATDGVAEHGAAAREVEGATSAVERECRRPGDDGAVT